MNLEIKKKLASSYYISRPTPKEEAEKFKPQKIEADKSDSQLQPAQPTLGSSWNPGNTMEEFDYSSWAKDRLKELLLLIKFPNSDLIIEKIDEMEGSATILFTRGKLRPGYDLHFQCTWKGKIDNSDEIEGTLSMSEICPEDDPDEWEFSVKSKQSTADHKKSNKIN